MTFFLIDEITFLIDLLVASLRRLLKESGG